MSPLSHGELRQMEEAAKGPVEIIFAEQKEIFENGIIRVVQDSKIKVNKAQLIRALELDKELREGKLVEVVRCKDCKNCRPFYRDKGICDLWATDGIDVFNDGFCNYGERRNPDDNP